MFFEDLMIIIAQMLLNVFNQKHEFGDLIFYFMTFD